MEQHIISGARSWLDLTPTHAAADNPPTPIIADAGSSAELLLFPAHEVVIPGARFLYRGSWWIVTDDRRDSGILVAEPVWN